MDPSSISRNENLLTIAYLNIHGQSTMSDAKQVQIEDFLSLTRLILLTFRKPKSVMKPSPIVILYPQITTYIQIMQPTSMEHPLW